MQKVVYEAPVAEALFVTMERTILSNDPPKSYSLQVYEEEDA